VQFDKNDEQKFSIPIKQNAHSARPVEQDREREREKKLSSKYQALSTKQEYPY
jgi:hypothetical protein